MATGEHVALVVDIDLKPGMHIYAPGVQGGYIPVDWRQPDSDAAKSLPMVYPPAKILRLEAIRETVPVYKGNARFVRDMVIGSDAKLKPLLDAAANFTIEGSLQYQACDDVKCYLPVTVPLKWILHYQPMDRQRVSPDLQHKAPG